MRASLLVLVVLSSLSPAQVVRAEDDVQSIEWNVFLDHWQLLGPFSKPDGDTTGLESELVTDQSSLRAGRVCFHDGRLITWQPNPGRVVNFRSALNAANDAGTDKVAFAVTQFSSPVAQRVRLSVGYDDHVIAWINGREVLRGSDNWASSLDQVTADVELQAGVNTLLLRVANGTAAWDAAARLLPVELTAPLLEFQASPAGNVSRLPTVIVELLDARRQTIARHRCSGGRREYPGTPGYYALYAAAPDTEPAFVRFTVDEPGFHSTESVFPWLRATKGNVSVPLTAAEPVQLTVVDRRTGKPVAGAAVWTKATCQAAVSDDMGRIQLPDLSPMADRHFVVAAGYRATPFNLSWPRRGVQQVALLNGGRSLTGVVTTEDGTPLPGATVSTDLSGYEPTAVTDEAGHFTIHGLQANESEVTFNIDCPGYISRAGLQPSPDERGKPVTWTLAAGATIVGRVTHAVTGEPVAGVQLTIGESRYMGRGDMPQTRSNANGEYRLTGITPGRHTLNAFSDNHAPDMRQIALSVGDPVEVNFQIHDGQPVSGTITDPAGKPVAGVWLITDSWNGIRMFRRETRTDAMGRYTLAHMPEASAAVAVLKQGYISQRDVWMSGGQTHDLVLNPTVIHTIHVRDASGEKTIPDLQIARGYLWDGNPGWSWRSDDWETTQFYDAAKGDMRIELDEQYNAEIAFRFRAIGYVESIVKLPRDATAGQVFDVRLKPAETRAGRVVDEAGQPLADIIVAMLNRDDVLRLDHYSDFRSAWQHVKDGNSTVTFTTTDRDGQFRLPVPAPRDDAALVLLSRDGGFQFHPRDPLAIPAKKAAEPDPETSEPPASAALPPITLTMSASGSLSGRLKVGGAPIRDAALHLRWLGPVNAAVEDDGLRVFGVGGEVITDAEGRFSFGRLGAGRYQVSRTFGVPLEQGGNLSYWLDSDELELRSGEDLVHEIELPEGVTLSGVVLSEDGPLPGAAVAVMDQLPSTRRIAMTIADAQGRFTLEHVPPGEYRLFGERYERHPQGFYNVGHLGTQPIEVTVSATDIPLKLNVVRQQ